VKELDEGKPQARMKAARALLICRLRFDTAPLVQSVAGSRSRIASSLASLASAEAVTGVVRSPSTRQMPNSTGTNDLLAIDSEATLYLIEVKKGRTPREVVAQALDYGYWVAELTLDEVASIYAAGNSALRYRSRPKADHRLAVC
jgi:hypothetical protein